MFLRNIFQSQRRVSPYLLLLLILLMPSGTSAQEKLRGDVRFQNEKWVIEGDIVIITYELIAPLERTYDVSVVLRRERDKSFALVPKTITGAVGVGKYGGGKREIRWDYKKDVPEGLIGDDYRFDLTATEIVEGAGSNWWLYAAGGAVAVAGGIVLLSGQGGDGGTPPAGGGRLPDPPAIRPVP